MKRGSGSGDSGAPWVARRRWSPIIWGRCWGCTRRWREEENGEKDPARQALRRRARAALLWEHLLSWLPAFLVRARELGSPAYRAWARILGEALTEEARTLARSPERPST